MNYNKTKRNYLGLLCWFLVACVISIIALFPMIARERIQAKQGGFALEYDDIAFYTFAILVGSGINAALVQWICGV